MVCERSGVLGFELKTLAVNCAGVNETRGLHGERLRAL